jgi:hypothetical protein
VGRCGLDACGSGQGPVVGPCEHGNGPSGYVRGRNLVAKRLLASQEGLFSM